MSLMDYLLANSPLETLETECLIVAVYEDKQLSPTASQLDSQTSGLITSIMQRGDIKGKVADTLLINYLPHANIKRAILVGLGNIEKLNTKDYRKALSAAASLLKKTQISSALCCLTENKVQDQSSTWKARQIVETIDANLISPNAALV